MPLHRGHLACGAQRGLRLLQVSVDFSQQRKFA